MAIISIDINQFLSKSETYPVIDVRSPSEYAHAHIPGAYNLPLFSDEERKIVGTVYKQDNRENAIKAGLKFFGPQMISMIEEIENLTGNKKLYAANTGQNYNSKKTVLVHCWRGGMRSAGVAWLLDLYGFKVYTLMGGYKNFRQWCYRQFEAPLDISIVGGYTGSGKTGVIHQLKKQHLPAIDLEGLASHKGSAFGGIGMDTQPTQEMFENLLALELTKFSTFQNNLTLLDNVLPKPGHAKTDALPGPLQAATKIWVEDESQRIGNLNLPLPFWLQMRKSHVYFLDISFEDRLDYLVEDYGKCEREKISDAIMRIKKRLGGLETKTAVNFLLGGNLKECFRILLTYYDKYYLKGLQNREDWQQMVTYVACPSVATEDNTRALLNTHLKQREAT